MYPQLLSYLCNLGFLQGEAQSIIKILQQFFVETIDLDSLESIFEAESDPYLDFFKSLMHKLYNCRKEAQVIQEESWYVQTVHDLLNTESEISEAPLLIKKEKTEGLWQPSKRQIGFAEKLYAGTLLPLQPLSEYDILRALSYSSTVGVRVASIKILTYLAAAPTSYHRSRTYFINLAKGSESAWIVFFNYRNTIFSPFCLSPEEKDHLNKMFPSVIFAESTIDDRRTSGFIALAYYYQHLMTFHRKINISIDNDFSVIYAKIGALLFPASSPQKSSLSIADQQMAPEEISYFLSLQQKTSSSEEAYFTLTQIGFSFLSQLLFLETSLFPSEYNFSSLSDLLKSIKEASLSSTKLLELYKQSYYFYSPELAEALLYLFADKQLDQFDINTLLRHEKISAILSKPHGIHSSQMLHEKAGSLLITYLRTFITQESFSINLESYVLSDEQLNHLTELINNNPYVKQISIQTTKNNIQQAIGNLTPIFARNQWLKEAGCNIKKNDNYWKKAAEYTIKYLVQHNDSILTSGSQHASFRKLISAMDADGLKATLGYLEEEKETLRITLNQKSLCLVIENEEDISIIAKMAFLKAHLQNKRYFPFNQISLPISDFSESSDYCEFINHLNNNQKSTNSFNMIYITNITRLNANKLEALLLMFIKEAQENQWKTLIVIPEIENIKEYDEFIKWKSSLSLYSQINNIILNNQRAFSLQLLMLESDELIPEEISALSQKSDAEIMINLETGLDQERYFLGKSFQIQHQQQEQEQQQQQEQQQDETQHLENEKAVLSSLPNKLYGYYDLGFASELMKEYEEFKKRTPAFFEDSFITLSEENASPLQNLFHTWINANPIAWASSVIKKMTKEAIFQILNHARHFTSGIDIHNLPQGFYLQRNDQHQLVLNYDPLRLYSTPHNAFTLKLTSISEPKAWRGSFEQLEDSIEGCLLFISLQPDQESSYLTNHDHIIQYIDTLYTQEGKTLPDSIKSKIYSYWDVFELLLCNKEYKNTSEIEKCLDEIMTIKERFDFEKQFSRILVNQSTHVFMQTAAFTETNLKALGQIFYLHGKKGLNIVLRELELIKEELGLHAWYSFKNNFIDPSSSLSHLINNQTINTLREIRKALKHDERKLQLWNQLIRNHVRHVGESDVTQLWKAFTLFESNLSSMELILSSEKVAGIEIFNMLTWMDRLHRTLDHIGDYQNKLYIINNLCQFDLTHGGIHYAVVHENFSLCMPSMQLERFIDHKTYTVKLSELYKAPAEVRERYFNRFLASLPWITQARFNFFLPLFVNNLISNDVLILIATIIIKDADFNNFFEFLNKIQQAAIPKIVDNIYDRSINESISPQVDLDTLIKLSNAPGLVELLDSFSGKKILDTLVVLNDAGKLNDSAISVLTQVCTDINEYKRIRFIAGMSSQLYMKLISLSVLLGVYKTACCFDCGTITILIKEIENTQRPSIKQAVDYVCRYIFMIDTVRSTQNMSGIDLWKNFNIFIENLIADPSSAESQRVTFLKNLYDQGIRFKLSLDQSSRLVEPKDALEKLVRQTGLDASSQSFITQFITDHIAIPDLSHEASQLELKNLITFFKSLSRKARLADELSYILSTLQEHATRSTSAGMWKASFLFKLLKMICPIEADKQYPISLLHTLLDHSSLEAKPLNEIQDDIPHSLVQKINEINKFTICKQDQNQLIRLALIEFYENNKFYLNNIIVYTYEYLDPILKSNHLASFKHTTSSLEIARQAKHNNQVFLLEPPLSFIDYSIWNELRSIAVLAYADTDKQEFLDFLFIDNNPIDPTQYDEEELKKIKNEKREILSLIFLITVRSVLTLTGKSKAVYSNDLIRKAIKLIKNLKNMSREDLTVVVKYCMKDPAPSADSLLRLIKHKKADNNKPLSEDDFSYLISHPFPGAARVDHGFISANRRVDLERMLNQIRIGIHSSAQPSLETLTIELNRLKDFESGIEFIAPFSKPIIELTQEELILSLNQTNPKEERTAFLAILFEAHYRKTGLYPTLAQQLALLSLDLGLDEGMRALQLDTGEGKTAIIALRAAFYALQKIPVTICTANRDLAYRDEKLYREYFKYLGLATTYLTPLSSKQSYDEANIIYSTIGDLSLFKSYMDWNGTPVENHEVYLLDEGDFTLFEEEYSTQFNFADTASISYHETKWFYDAVNYFYDACSSQFQVDEENRKFITPSDVNNLFIYLKQIAENNPLKEKLLRSVQSNPLSLVSWLQAAHAASVVLKSDKDYSIRPKRTVEIGREQYLLNEIVPLSSANQPIDGAVFSDGIHQLLAARLNEALLQEGKAPIVYAPAEGLILDSEIVSKRLEMPSIIEMYTGTISVEQINSLRERGIDANVLYMPTNQPSLREYHSPIYCEDSDDQFEKIYLQLKLCIQEKKSVLIVCKNDLEAKRYHDLLKERGLTDNELEIFISSDNRQVEEMITAKNEKENVVKGKKNAALGLVSSRLGRGNNLDVEVVFILDPYSQTNFLQNAGRTGRKNKAGEVFEFYNLAKIRHELISLMTEHSHLPIVIHYQADRNLFSNSSFMKDVLMAIKKELTEEQRKAEYGHQRAITDYCNWFMSIISNKNKEEHDVLTEKWKHQQERISKIWTNITARLQKSSANEQISAFQEKIKLLSEAIAPGFNFAHKKLPLPLISLKENEGNLYNYNEDIKKIAIENQLSEIDAARVFYFVDQYKNKFSLDEEMLLSLVIKAISGNPIMRLRILNTWEKWDFSFKENGNKYFLLNVLNVLQNIPGDDPELIIKILIKKTNFWFNHFNPKGHSSSYEKSILKAWENLKVHSKVLITSPDLVLACLHSPGKGWLFYLNTLFEFNDDLIIKQSTLLTAFLDWLNTLKINKALCFHLFEKFIGFIQANPNEDSLHQRTFEFLKKLDSNVLEKTEEINTILEICYEENNHFFLNSLIENISPLLKIKSFDLLMDLLSLAGNDLFKDNKKTASIGDIIITLSQSYFIDKEKNDLLFLFGNYTHFFSLEKDDTLSIINQWMNFFKKIHSLSIKWKDLISIQYPCDEDIPDDDKTTKIARQTESLAFSAKIRAWAIDEMIVKIFWDWVNSQDSLDGPSLSKATTDYLMLTSRIEDRLLLPKYVEEPHEAKEEIEKLEVRLKIMESLINQSLNRDPVEIMQKISLEPVPVSNRSNIAASECFGNFFTNLDKAPLPPTLLTSPPG